jgi:hypothetical protein
LEQAPEAVLHQKLSPGHSPSARFLSQKPKKGEASKEARSEGRSYIKRSRAAVVEAKQRIQHQKPIHLHPYIYQMQTFMVFF